MPAQPISELTPNVHTLAAKTDTDLAQFSSQHQCHHFRFHGHALEYLGIWMVNFLLTIVTLTLYSPWAKARRLRYFYINTECLQQRFDFTALPLRILWGRLFALELYIVGLILLHYSVMATSSLLLILALILPWLLRMSLSFKARNSSFGYVSFYFSGRLKDAYKTFALMVVLSVGSLFIASPLVIWLYKRYCFNHLQLGQFKFNLDVHWSVVFKAVYIPVLICLGLTIGWLSVIGSKIETFGLNWQTGVLVAGYMFILFMIWPMIQARLYKMTWNHLKLNQSYFKTRISLWRYSWIKFTNTLLRILSLGILTPWAAIRLYRYQMAHLDLYLAPSDQQLETMLCVEQSAVADELLSFFDLDVSL
jgi:uncharacterized membrane protein YjgN (DUF898 family)